MAFTPGFQNSRTNGTTAVECVSAPASDTVRVTRNVTIYNNDSIPHTLIFYKKIGSDKWAIGGGTVAAGDQMTLDGSQVLDDTASITIVLGEVKTTNDCDVSANFADET